MKVDYPIGSHDKLVAGKHRLAEMLGEGPGISVRKRRLVSADGRTRTYMGSTPGGRIVKVDVDDEESTGGFRILLPEQLVSLGVSNRILMVSPEKGYDATELSLSDVLLLEYVRSAAGNDRRAYIYTQSGGIDVFNFVYRVDLVNGVLESRTQLDDWGWKMGLTPDGSRILTLHSDDETLKCWDAETFALLGSVVLPFNVVSDPDLWVDPSGDFITVGSSGTNFDPTTVNVARVSIPDLAVLSTVNDNPSDVVRARVGTRTYISALGLFDYWYDQTVYVYDDNVLVGSISGVYLGKFAVSPDGSRGYYIPSGTVPFATPGPDPVNGNACTLREIDTATLEVTQDILPYDDPLAPQGSLDFAVIPV